MVYKAWTDKTGVHTHSLTKKLPKNQNHKSICTHVYIAWQRECNLLHDRTVLSTGRTPHDKQNNWLDYNKNLVMSPGGSSKPWLT